MKEAPIATKANYMSFRHLQTVSLKREYLPHKIKNILGELHEIGCFWLWHEAVLKREEQL